MNEPGFGLLGIFRKYFPKDFFLDLIAPMIIGVIIVGIQSAYPKTTYSNLITLLNYAIVYLPAMAAIILTAYTMMVSALKSSFDFDQLKKNLGFENIQDGNHPQLDDSEITDLLDKAVSLKSSISASFAANIIISISCLLICMIMYIVGLMQITSEYDEIINLISLGIVVMVIIYPISAIIGVVSDMFSISQI